MMATHSIESEISDISSNGDQIHSIIQQSKGSSETALRASCDDSDDAPDSPTRELRPLRSEADFRQTYKMRSGSPSPVPQLGSQHSAAASGLGSLRDRWRQCQRQCVRRVQWHKQ